MKFIHDLPPYELTYSDVFLIPNKSDIKSRMDIDLTTIDGLGTTTPVIAANMNSVAGKRMAETLARRGAMVMLLQNMPLEKIKDTVDKVKAAHPVFETPVAINQKEHAQKALNLIHKRSHGAVVIVDDGGLPVGMFTESDARGKDRYEHLVDIMSTDLITVDSKLSTREMFEELVKHHIEVAPVMDGKKMLGVVTRKGLVRSSIFKPALDKNGKLKVGVAIGINEDVPKRIKALEEMGVDVVLIDTAHGHQNGMMDAIKQARKASKDMYIIAGTVVTAQGTKDILNAGANMVKVGIGAGAVCTTRMMTGVGRPQLSAVMECVEAAKELDGFVMADGGIRHPRDVAIALAAGAATTMFGSWFAGTYESPADIHVETDGRMYKEQYGMASNRAVIERNQNVGAYEKLMKEFFEEGVSGSKMYIKPGEEGAEDVLDSIVAGLRSACSYTGANNLKEFHEKAVLGVQSPAAYNEGKPVAQSWT